MSEQLRDLRRGLSSLDVGKTISLRRRVNRHGPFLGALAFYLVMMAVFILAAPSIWSQWPAWASVFTSLPIILFLAIPLAFLIAAGEIDLSFASAIGVAGWIFALCVQAGWGPVAGLILAGLVGLAIGLLNGVLVSYVGLSSLVTTLGMYFLWRGVVVMGTQGIAIPVLELEGGWFSTLFTGRIGSFGFPVQMLWGLGFAAVAMFVFSRHRFGAHVRFVGDNPAAAREMGVNVSLTKILAFAFVGVCAAFAAILTVLINGTAYPNAGDGYLLLVIAAVFVGGTPPWGGVATIAGVTIGAFTIGFVETGLIGMDLSGYYTQFFYGLVIILSLLGYRLLAGRYLQVK